MISIKEEVIRQSKALADKSKLDILCSLKESSKYNLELAEALDSLLRPPPHTV